VIEYLINVLLYLADLSSGIVELKFVEVPISVIIQIRLLGGVILGSKTLVTAGRH